MKKTAVIFGATGVGKQVFEQAKDKYEILYFVDGNPELIGGDMQRTGNKECGRNI